MNNKQLADELRVKYIKNPPEGMTPSQVQQMSVDDLLDMHYFLTENDFDEAEKAQPRCITRVEPQKTQVPATGIEPVRDLTPAGF